MQANRLTHAYLIHNPSLNNNACSLENQKFQNITRQYTLYLIHAIDSAKHASKKCQFNQTQNISLIVVHNAESKLKVLKITTTKLKLRMN